jgi:hypothetical protein
MNTGKESTGILTLACSSNDRNFTFGIIASIEAGVWELDKVMFPMCLGQMKNAF